MSSLRSILGGSKVQKRRTAHRPTGQHRQQQLPRPSSSRDDDFAPDKLDDLGLAASLASDLSLRDVPQALRHARTTMFDPMPSGGGGMNSVRTGAVLRFRRALPPVASAAHVHALLRSATATEREIAERVRAGTVRRVVVPRRGGVGEALVETAALEDMARACGGLAEGTRAEFGRWLREEGGPRVRAGRFDTAMVDELVRAGFLTADGIGGAGGSENLFSRPEDRTTLMSLATVARAASGSVAAVGGEGAVHAVGGSGSRGRGGEDGELSLAVPGNGAYLKLVSSALSHLTALLSKSPHREAPETLLREKWDGGVARDERQYAARRARGELFGVLPGRTKKWKDFYGLSFYWILAEAVGAGLV